ncbi:PrgI family protein [Caproiciproducens sp. NJN-50]|uniref:PrgI family protein n=1 Tax=Caproiciproducens sp. NJN-50 TaxID=2507162 RepID=UPI000FFE029E|nr:PrgI family protein [Caproiciproducens sp. NJN-50]QAT48778.1 PrgI family protein [Caproiciproducens sp. NJN-50]
MIVPIPDDIYSYEHKVAGNFTKRQLVCLGIALAVIVLIFVPVFWKTGNPRLSTLLSASAAVPVLYGAIHEKDGQHLEQILRYRYRQHHKFPQKRKFVMTNLYETIQQNQKEYDAAYEKLQEQDGQKAEKGHHWLHAALAQKKHRPGKRSV